MSTIETYEEIPKYRKKKSSKSKSESKANHKHQYMDCLLVDDNNRPAEYCEICGKINNIQFFEMVESDNASARLMTTDEIFQKYKNLEQFRVKDVRDKYVPISQ